MAEGTSLEEMVRQGRPWPSVPARIGRHDVLVEAGPIGTSVYQIRGGRVLTLRANKGYREDVAAALLDAVDDLADAGDLGSTVRMPPIEGVEFALDRAVLLGPEFTDFFRTTPLADRGMQVIPVHRCEVRDGEEYDAFWPSVLGKNLGIRHLDWTREPSPRADVRRLDDGKGGLYRAGNSRRNSKPALTRARSVLEQDCPGLLDGVRLSVVDVRGHDLRLHREWDRLRGTLQIPGRAETIEVDVPRLSAWAVFGPMFGGADFDPAALSAATAEPPEDMLEIQVNDAERRRHDGEGRPATLRECLAWLRALARTEGDFLVFSSRSGRILQMRRQDRPGREGPRLWAETPEPTLRRSRGR